ncbi:MAG: hypothetical protein LUG54_08415 [Clostridiales bacterium]|nr:hypothetical protein [Clostridiales bacterium]
MNAYEVVERIRQGKIKDDDEWLQLRDDIVQFLKEEHPEEEKRCFRPFGYFEVVKMVCDGIEKRRNGEMKIEKIIIE